MTDNELNPSVDIEASVEADSTIEMQAEVETESTVELTADVEMGGLASEYNAEAWAVGQRHGVDVPSTDQTYQNNAKWWAQQAASAASVAPMIAPNYADLTFPVTKGQHCTHEGGYYEAKQDISISEDWTAAHWESVTVGGEVSDLKNAFDALGLSVVDGKLCITYEEVSA